MSGARAAGAPRAASCRPPPAAPPRPPRHGSSPCDPGLEYHPSPPMTASSNTNPNSGAASGDAVTMEKIVALSKRRGFVFPSSEIYGGAGSTYDFGHYGVLLKGTIKSDWSPA